MSKWPDFLNFIDKIGQKFRNFHLVGILPTSVKTRLIEKQTN